MFHLMNSLGSEEREYLQHRIQITCLQVARVVHLKPLVVLLIMHQVVSIFPSHLEMLYFSLVKQKQIGGEERGSDVTLEIWPFGAALKRRMYTSPLFSLRLSASSLSSSSSGTLIAFLLKGQMPVGRKDRKSVV